MVEFSQRKLWQVIHGKSMSILFLTLRERRGFGPCTRLPSWKGMIFADGIKNSDSAYGLVLVELKLLGSIGFPKTVKQRAQYKFAEILRKGVTSANLVICDWEM